MSQMQPRQVAQPTMLGRQSSDATVSHFTYEQVYFEFEQQLATYEYTSFRGEMQPRTIGTVQMKGR